MNKKLKNVLDYITDISWDNFIEYHKIIKETVKFYSPYFKTPKNINFDYVIEKPYVNQETDVIKFLANLKKNGMIKDFSISKSKTPIVQKKYHPIILKIIDIKIDLSDNGLILKLFNHVCVEQFKDELYGEQKQLSIICNGIYKKYLDFQNNEVALHFYSPDSLAEVGSCIAKNDIKHIKIMDILHKLEFIKYLEITDCNTVQENNGDKIFPIKATVKILDLEKIKKLAKSDVKLEPNKGYSKNIIFDAEKSLIQHGNNVCKIPYNTNQAILCDFMFNKHEKSKRVSWDEIYCFIKGADDIQKNGWRTIYNAVNEINKKTKGKLGKEIFVFDQKTVRLVQ